jgi:hypothetical protein
MKRKMIISQLQDFSIKITPAIFNMKPDTAVIRLCGDVTGMISPALPLQMEEDDSDNKGNDALTPDARLLLPQPGLKVQCLNLEEAYVLKAATQSLCYESTTTAANTTATSLQPCRDHETVACFLRSVDTVCSICLEHYKILDTVCWSSNRACCHVFHQNCILDWLMSIYPASSNQNDNGINTSMTIRRTPNSSTINATDEEQALQEANGGSNSSIRNPNVVATGDATAEQQQGGEELMMDQKELTCPCCRSRFIDVRNI